MHGSAEGISLGLLYILARLDLFVAELTVGHILWPVAQVTHQSADPLPAWPVTHDPVPDHGGVVMLR